MVYCIIQGATDYNFFLNKIVVFFSMKSIFVLANSVDPNEMPHYAAFNLGLHCLQLYVQIIHVFIPLLTVWNQ